MKQGPDLSAQQNLLGHCENGPHVDSMDLNPSLRSSTDGPLFFQLLSLLGFINTLISYLTPSKTASFSLHHPSCQGFLDFLLLFTYKPVNPFRSHLFPAIPYTVNRVTL